MSLIYKIFFEKKILKLSTSGHSEHLGNFKMKKLIFTEGHKYSNLEVANFKIGQKNFFYKSITLAPNSPQITKPYLKKQKSYEKILFTVTKKDIFYKFWQNFENF